MASVVQPFQIGTNNLVNFTLRQNGVPVPYLPSVDKLEIFIGETVLISRITSNDDGVDFSQGTGKVVINPGELSEDLSALKTRRYTVLVKVTDSLNGEGVVFGGAGAADQLYFDVTHPPPVI